MPYEESLRVKLKNSRELCYVMLRRTLNSRPHVITVNFTEGSPCINKIVLCYVSIFGMQLNIEFYHMSIEIYV